MIRYYFVVFLTAMILLPAGCNKGPKIVPISGKITIDNQPLKTGVIMVYQSGYRPASATIQSDGSFTFQTLANNDGCLLGEHPITVMSNKIISPSKTEFYIPQRYGDINRADTKIKIDGKNNDLVINLTWKGS